MDLICQLLRHNSSEGAQRLKNKKLTIRISSSTIAFLILIIDRLYAAVIMFDKLLKYVAEKVTFRHTKAAHHKLQFRFFLSLSMQHRA